MWKTFPQVLEQKINALLDEAEPNPLKAFQLYKACQRENSWQGSFDKFSQKISNYFSLPKAQRKKSDLDRHLHRPLSASLYEDFHLCFGNALLNSKTLLDIASWAHNLMRVGYKTESVVISQDVLTRTLQQVTNPPPFAKVQFIKFQDFCDTWKKVVLNLFGKKYDAEFQSILNELYWLETQLKNEENAVTKEVASVPTIYLTQTEIDWTMAVRKAAEENAPIPKFPLSKGPQKQRLIQLLRAISLYKIVQTTRLPEFIKHRDNIRTTILYQCDSLLKETAR
ncbi:MAG: hypothetical protein ACXVCP_09130 [Bdellovibrio sp.]